MFALRLSSGHFVLCFPCWISVLLFLWKKQNEIFTTIRSYFSGTLSAYHPYKDIFRSNFAEVGTKKRLIRFSFSLYPSYFRHFRSEIIPVFSGDKCCVWTYYVWVLFSLCLLTCLLGITKWIQAAAKLFVCKTKLSIITHDNARKGSMNMTYWGFRTLVQ